MTNYTAYLYPTAARRADLPPAPNGGLVAQRVVPLAPTAITATPASATEIDLAWTWPSYRATPVCYLVERSTSEVTTTFQQIAVTSSASYSDTGVVASTQYYYRVRAVVATGTLGAYSDLVAAITNAPAVPLAPGGISGSSSQSDHVSLTWSDVADDTGYKVERSTIPGASGFAQIGTTGTSVASYADTGLTAGTTYYYRVRATNASGDGPYSEVAAVTTAANAAPSNLVASAITDVRIDLSWTDNTATPNETSFSLQRSSTPDFTSPATISISAGSTSYSDTGRSPATTYFYRIKAVEANGDSAYSSVEYATTPGVPIPATPIELIALPANATTIALTWEDEASNETAYYVERATSFGGSYSVIATLGANAVSYSDTPVTPATLYYYRVRAHNADGYSSYSNIAAAQTSLASLVVTAAPVDSTHIRVTFSAAVLDNAALRCVDAYSVTRDDDDLPLAIHAVTPEAITHPTYVDLTVDEQKDGLTYNVSIALIERA